MGLYPLVWMQKNLYPNKKHYFANIQIHFKERALTLRRSKKKNSVLKSSTDKHTHTHI